MYCTVYVQYKSKCIYSNRGGGLWLSFGTIRDLGIVFRGSWLSASRGKLFFPRGYRLSLWQNPWPIFISLPLESGLSVVFKRLWLLCERAGSFRRFAKEERNFLQCPPFPVVHSSSLTSSGHFGPITFGNEKLVFNPSLNLINHDFVTKISDLCNCYQFLVQPKENDRKHANRR